MTERDSGWLVGIFEGEGTCGVYTYATGKRVILAIASTDRDVLETCKRLTGVGSIRQNRPATDATKALHVWQVQNKRDVAKVCALVYEGLHLRRRVQMNPVLQFCADA